MGSNSLKHSTYVADAIKAADQRGATPLGEFLRQVRPEVERLLNEYQLPLADAETILSDVLQTLVWRWESIRSREAWLLAVLDKKLACWARQEPAN